MDIYVNSSDRKAYLEVPVTALSGTLEVEIYKDGELVHTASTVSLEDGRYGVTVPFRFVNTDKTLDIKWSFDYIENSQTYTYTKNTKVDIVTPILTPREIKVIHPNATDEEVVRIERAVRTIINAHTGQTFGHYEGSFFVRGNDKLTLNLPARLMRLESVNDSDADEYFVIDGDGYLLKHFPWGVPPVKADYFELHQHNTGVIHNPNNVKLGEFYKSMTYKVTGEWGYDKVPEAVAEAARLLVNDYACGDAAYRDRYLTSMTAADWRIQFHSGAFLKTGNVRADQLLSDYVLKRGWAVI